MTDDRYHDYAKLSFGLVALNYWRDDFGDTIDKLRTREGVTAWTKAMHGLDTFRQALLDGMAALGDDGPEAA